MYKLNRRQTLQRLTLAGAGIITGSSLVMPSLNQTRAQFQHSVCRWCFPDIPLEELALAVRDLGISSIELLKPDEWKVVHNLGLTCAVATAGFISLTKGFNDPGQHEQLQKNYLPLLRSAAAAGIPQVICFSGNRRGISEENGLEFCARGLDLLVREAEKLGITLIMELLNSRIDHPDYQCDATQWGAALVEKIGSDHFKLLYDIYHMQIMEGDIISTIGRYAKYINHYHTAGVPGRHEIDDTQELYYPAIMKAIAKTGFTGYVAQEFIPAAKNPLESLRRAVEICDIKG